MVAVCLVGVVAGLLTLAFAWPLPLLYALPLSALGGSAAAALTGVVLALRHRRPAPASNPAPQAGADAARRNLEPARYQERTNV